MALIDVPIAALEFEAVAVPADDNFPGNRVFRYLVTDDIAKLKYDGPM